MPIPSLTGIETALSGLEAAQAAIDTTGNNIDNASTPGYTQEVVNLDQSLPQQISAESPQGDGFTQLGTGVDVNSITRVRNQFLDVQYRAQNTVANNASTTASQLGDAQSALGESGSTTGLSGQLSQFWSDWNTVADNPSSLAAQTTLVADATTLTTSINNLNSQLATIQTNATSQFNALTGSGGQLQSDANQIATLNGAISQQLAEGQDPNDLEDQRDSVLDDLSSLGQISVSDPGNGQLTVNFGDAAEPLVQGTTVTWPQTITSATGGQLGALLSTASSSGPIGTYATSLNSVAANLASSVNAIATTTPFFKASSGSTVTAANIEVATTAGNVQTSSTGTPGGNDVATAIANLQGGTADQTYAALVALVGANVQAAQTSATNSQAIANATNTQRESISGVSLDQEMTNLITYQRGYEASARSLSTLDDVLNTLITEVGQAGM
jgi:flagellar hook-associated protein 1 FlgK